MQRFAWLALLIGISWEVTLPGLPKLRLTDLAIPLLLWGLPPRSAGRKEPIFAWMGLLCLWDWASFMCGFAFAETSSLGALYLGKRFELFLLFALAYRWASAWRDGSPESRSLRTILQWFIVGYCILALSVLLDLGMNFRRGSFRASGLVPEQQASVSLFLVTTVSLLAGLYPSYSARSRRGEFWYLVSLGLIAVLATGTRGMLIVSAVVFGAACLAGMIRKPLPLSLGLIATFLAAGLFLPDHLQQRMGSSVTSFRDAWREIRSGQTVSSAYSGNSLVVRLVNANYVASVEVPRAFWCGHGTGSRVLGAIDVFYLSEWLYHGLVGLLLWLAWSLSVVRAHWRLAGQENERWMGQLHRGLWLAWITFFVAGLHSDSFYLVRPMEALMLWSGLALGSAAGCREAQRELARPWKEAVSPC